MLYSGSMQIFHCLWYIKVVSRRSLVVHYIKDLVLSLQQLRLLLWCGFDSGPRQAWPKKKKKRYFQSVMTQILRLPEIWIPEIPRDWYTASCNRRGLLLPFVGVGILLPSLPSSLEMLVIFNLCDFTRLLMYKYACFFLNYPLSSI